MTGGFCASFLVELDHGDWMWCDQMKPAAVGDISEIANVNEKTSLDDFINWTVFLSGWHFEIKSIAKGSS